MSDLAILRTAIDAVLTEENQLFRTIVPNADQLGMASSRPLDATYYLRHRIETLHRVRATAKTAALALTYMIDEDYDAARTWARHVEQGMTHDQLFLQDLSRHQVTVEQVAATPPFASTVELVRYLAARVPLYGSLPAVAYAVFVEWNSERFALAPVERVQAAFSAEHAKGARAPAGVDDKHLDMVLEVAHRVVSRSGTVNVLFIVLREIAALFRAYFTELHWWTIVQPRRPLGEGNALLMPRRAEGDRAS